MKKYYKAICFLFSVLIIGILYKFVFMKTVEGHGGGGGRGGRSCWGGTAAAGAAATTTEN